MAVTDRGFVEVDNQQRTNVEHVFAIGDVVGQPMLAHKAVHEGKVAAEVVAGKNSAFDARVIPSVAYTDPEVAWVGVTENEAKAQGLSYGSGTFPWAASGRSLSLGRSEGSTKLLFDTETDRIIGAGIVGPAAGDLITEAALAIEMGADAADIGLTIHPHPTLSETVGHGGRGVRGHADRPLPAEEAGEAVGRFEANGTLAASMCARVPLAPSGGPQPAIGTDTVVAMIAASRVSRRLWARKSGAVQR